MATTEDRHKNGREDPPHYPEKQLDVSEKIDHDRLRSIDEARRRIREVRERAQLAQLKGEISREEAGLAYRDALESYLLEIKQYRSIDETARGFWDGSVDSSIGGVVIQPPRDNEAFESADPVNVAEFGGLDDILAAPVYFSHTFETRVKPRNCPSRMEEETVNKPIPRSVLDNALMWANQYVHHIGLDLQLEQTVDAEAEPY